MFVLVSLSTCCEPKCLKIPGLSALERHCLTVLMNTQAVFMHYGNIFMDDGCCACFAKISAGYSLVVHDEMEAVCFHFIGCC